MAGQWEFNNKVRSVFLYPQSRSKNVNVDQTYGRLLEVNEQSGMWHDRDLNFAGYTNT